jgi:hypothetical protein
MLTLGENPKEVLTNIVWEKWELAGYTKQPYALTWLEISHLANFFLKICREKNIDYQSYDFSTIIDYKLNYEENKSTIVETIGEPEAIEEKEAANKLRDYFTEDQLKEYSNKERSIIEEIQTDHQNLNKKLNQITKTLKSQETQIDPEELKHELEEMNHVQTLIYARLEQLPNLDQQLTALLKSDKFKDLGKAIQPIRPNITEPKEPTIEKQPKPKISDLASWFKKKHIKFLDAFAGFCTTVIWLGASYGIMQSYGLSWVSAIGLGIFWIFYVIAIRVLTGGLLD